MQTPDTPAGRITDQVMFEVRRANKHDALSVREYNILWSAVYKSFDKDPDPEATKLPPILPANMTPAMFIAGQVTRQIMHDNKGLPQAHLKMVGDALKKLFSKASNDEILGDGGDQAAEDVTEALAEKAVPPKIMKRIKTGRWIWLRDKKSGEICGIKRKSTGQVIRF